MGTNEKISCPIKYTDGVDVFIKMLCRIQGWVMGQFDGKESQIVNKVVISLSWTGVSTSEEHKR